MLTNTPKFVSVRNGLRFLHWLPIKQRIVFKALCTVFKALMDSGSDFLKSRFKWYVPARSLRSLTARQVTVPIAKTANWGDRSFSLGAAKAWNSLPLQLRNSSGLLAFRRDLKTLLFLV